MEEFSLQEVKQHKTKNNLWIIHSGKVYNVTAFIEKHPGGSEVLIQNAGEDVTAIMQNSSSHKHSSVAYGLLDEYKIGRIKGYRNGKTEVNGKHKNGLSNGNHKNYESSEFYDWSKDDLVDWNKPIFWQVGSLGEKYMDWCHQPVDKHIRLFYSDFCETFSKTAWYVIPIVWIPVSLILLSLSLLKFPTTDTRLLQTLYSPGLELNVYDMPVIFVMGVLLWTLLEYIVHRWLFHMTPPSKSAFLITAHFILHGQHHKSPFDRYRLVFPPVPATAFAVLFYGMYELLLPTPVALCLLAGTLVGYVCYDMTHYFLHHGGSPKLGYFQRLKRYHNLHHFKHQTSGFGISSKLWDYPFKTLIPEK